MRQFKAVSHLQNPDSLVLQLVQHGTRYLASCLSSRHAGSSFAKAKCIALLLTAILCMPLHAQQVKGLVVTKDVRGRGVLRVDYLQEIAPNGSQGSMHVQVTSPGGPSKSDRNLVIVLSFKYGSDFRQQSVAYRHSIQLAQGATNVKAEIPFYYVGGIFRGRIRILEDGSDIEDQGNSISAIGQLGSSFYVNNNSGVTRNIAAVLPSQASLKTFDGYLDGMLLSTQAASTSPLTQAGWADFASNTDMSKRARFANFASDDWRYYYSSEQWLIPLDALLEMQAGRPAALKAIKLFIASGGNVLVWSPDHEKAMREIDRWLEDVERAPEEFAPAENGWQFCKPAVSAGFDSYKSLSDWQEYRVYRKRYLLGNVWAANDMNNPLLDIPTSNAALQHHAAGSTKVSPGNDGAWFWRNLIRSVGKPPVWTFCAFVCLFGLVLGPGLLIITGRLGRRSLMIFFVPALSSIATLLIVFYGIFYEGFSTTIRVSGVIAIDQRTGEAFAWSRQNYFSGMPPGEGLVFGSQTYVRPVVSTDRSNVRSYPSDDKVSNYVDLRNDTQVWRNWLRARQQQQLLVGHATKSEMPISIELTAPKVVNLKNLTDDVLPIVIVRGAKDEYYFAEKLGPKAVVDCEAQDFDSAAVLAARVRANIRPSSPDELSSSGSSLLNFGRSRRGWAGNAYLSETLPDMINVCYEQYLSEDLELPPFGFVTVVQQSNAVEIPLKGEIVESSYLVVGTAKW